MPDLNWRSYSAQFTTLADKISDGIIPAGLALETELLRICAGDPAGRKTRLGVDPSLIAFLEFLFFHAEGPYASRFQVYAPVIRVLFSSSDLLRHMINHNAADAVANMILNKRGRLKFLIADHLELMILLDWWPWFGLEPVSERQVLDAVLHKPLLSHRLESGDPGILLRLLEVFPDFQHEYLPGSISRDDLVSRLAISSPPPSFRRYHHLFQSSRKEGRDLKDLIREEEERILPVHISRNTFLAYLVKKLYQDSCQICPFCRSAHADTNIEVHHIIPLSEGGSDKAWNMLVVCRYHHQAVHRREITVTISDQVCITSPQGSFLVTPAFQKPGI